MVVAHGCVMDKQHAFTWNGKDIVAASYGGRWHIVVEGRSILGPPMVAGRSWEREEQVIRVWLDLYFESGPPRGD